MTVLGLVPSVIGVVVNLGFFWPAQVAARDVSAVT